MKLANQYLALIALLVLLIGGSAAVVQQQTVGDALEARQREWAAALTAGVAEALAREIIDQHPLQLRESLGAIVERNPEVEFAYVTDFDGKVVAHTFGSSAPAFMAAAAANPAGAADHERRLMFEGKPVDEVSHAVIEGMPARLYLGLSSAQNRSLVERVGNELALILAVLGGIGLLVGLAVGKRITRPLELLSQQVQDYGASGVAPDFSVEAGSSELARLHDAFRGMAAARKQAEAALATSEERLRTILDSEPECVKLLDANCALLFMNPAGLRMIAAPSLDAVRGQNTLDLIEPQLRGDYREGVAAVFRGETTTQVFEMIGFDGQRRWVEQHAVPLRDPAQPDSVKQLLAVTRDITERKAAEERIRQALLEKETLLREIHHRVKNNLQVVASLLHLHARKLNDAASIEVFAEVRAQLRSMMLVHEKLYRSDDLARIDFGDYLRALVPDIANARATSGAVAVSVEAADALLPIETATPCGLMVSELLTNALRHAFPDGRTGCVKVSSQRDAGALVLRVADDGVGLPEGFDAAGADSFGWQLIHGLAAQVGATVEVARERGTVVRVVVPLKSEAAT